MKALTSHAKKLIYIAIAGVCLLVGLLTVWTPLPTGVPLIAVGVVLLVTVSATARRLMKGARSRSHRLDRGMSFVEERVGRNMSTMLKRTRPLKRKLEAKKAMEAASAALKSARARARAKKAKKEGGKSSA
ncbi:MAG: hypothetical protein AAGB11_00540 [Pseudomonadota bacterium]